LNKVLGAQAEGSWRWALSTAAAEESAKLATVIIFMRNKRFRWSLNGLLMGAAVGAGFAAFESAGYAVASAPALGLLQIMWSRAVLSPAGHVVWTALAT